MKFYFGSTFYIILFLQVFVIFGNTNKLVSIVENAKPDTNKVKMLSDLCYDYRFKSADSAIVFGEQALILARELNYPRGIAQSYNDLAIIYINQASYSKAIKYLNESLKIRVQLNDLTGMAALYNKLGIIDQKQGRLKEALENQIAALKIFQKLEHNKGIGYSLNNIAIIHQNLGNLDKSLEYHTKGLEYRIKLNDQEGEATSYSNMANLYIRMKDTTSALGYYKKALELSRSLSKDELISGNLSNMANILLAQKAYDKALKLYKESLDIRERLGDSKGISSTLSRMGIVYTEMKQYREASQVLKKSLQIAKRISVTEEELSALLSLAKLKALTNHLDSSFILMGRYVAAKDSIFDVRIKEQIIDVQTRYETDKLEQDLELVRKEKDYTEVKLKQRKTQILLLIFIFISITGAGIFLFYRHQQRQIAQASAERIVEQEKRMNAVLQAQEDERRRIAKELHDGIGQTLSAIRMNYQSLSNKLDDKVANGSDIKKIEKMLEHAGKEVRDISHQMIPKELEQFGLIVAVEEMLSQCLDQASVIYQFEHSGFEERVGSQVELVLFRVLQELVSNVVKHSKATRLHVQLIQLKSHVVLNVSDNGVGFNVDQKEKNGIGLLNIASRIDGIKGHLHYDSELGKGTTVTIRTPLI